MLVMFRFKNFSSFRDEVILDLRASSHTQHPSHVIKDTPFKLLKTLAIYGPNASGKSNLISAMHWFEQIIFSHLFQDSPEDEKSEGIEALRKLPPIRPFLLSEQMDPSIEFEMIFVHQEQLFQYGFTLQENIVISEWLNVNNHSVFERDPSVGITFGNKFKAQLRSFTKYREDRLYLSVLDYFATDDVKKLVDCFKDFFRNRFNVHFELIFESSIKGTVSSIPNSPRLVKDDVFRARVAEYIRFIDVGIEDIVIEKEEMFDDKQGKKVQRPLIKTIHPVFNSNGDQVDTKSFDLAQESSGTLRFLSFIQEVLILLERGGVFVIDELSARLHPLLTKFIVDLFQSDRNTNHAQLIFTTHDTSILNKEQFRRDEIVFVDKNELGVSSLYSLADLKMVRQDATYYKDYFSGKYGAIPIFQTSFPENRG
ncbi:AAA family ATPase [Paenibacillus sp. P96]|uniref:AAA family ATPase n=1 Tax=Paenibacillus zeirhizosphaerae TaxID=2987519 RepID=A0ABT9FPE1_9BACL|nr:ATP-binding protein [Paenibacillus sp. P96]MDP4096386.1 AAA family ATPase [Paenibacillus sp. P96]